MMTGIHRCTARWAGAVAIAVTIASGAMAQNQLPYIPPELYEEERRLQGDQISFCLWGTNPTLEFDRAVAEEIAAALLLEPSFHTFEPIDMTEDRFWQELRILLAEQCSVLVGFALVPEGYPDWLTPTRAYYRAPFTFAVTNEDYERLSDIEAGGIIGSRLGTEADRRFNAYLDTLPEDEGWRRFPYDSTDLLLEHLRNGVVEAGLLWEPQLWGALDGDPEAEGIRMLPLDPLPTIQRQLGMVVRQDDVYVRTLVDDATVNLIESGVIDELIDEFGLPGSAPPLE